jgi:hypothetical protein
VVFRETDGETPDIAEGVRGVLFFDSADRHGVSHEDALEVMNTADPIVLREDPPKLLYVGFDRQGRPREVITDTAVATGRVAVIHADVLTPSYYRYL